MRNVDFKRTRSAGLVANLWVYDFATSQLLFQIDFVNDEAVARLQENTPYVLRWTLSGMPGDELKVERRVRGVDATFEDLLTSSKIPADDHATRTGTRVSYTDLLQFTIP